MKESEFRILNECRVNVQQFECEFHLRFYAPEKVTVNNIGEFMIGHEEFGRLIRGSVPNYDDDGNIEDFPEIQPQVNFFDESRRFSKAFLLTGETGCGRHTVSDAFITEMLDIIREGIDGDSVTDDVFRYYRIDLSDICLVEKSRKLKVLEDMFSELTELAGSDWTQGMMVAVCLDDVTDILKNKKTAGYFVKQIKELLEQTGVIFYFTCIFDGKACEIRDRYKKPFIVYDISEPDEKMRMMYFNKLILRYRNIAPACEEAKLVQLTENFTFSMLEQFKKMYLMYAKSVVLNADRNLQDYILNHEVPAEELIIIPETAVEYLMEMIRKSRYVRSVGMPLVVSEENRNMLMTPSRTAVNDHSGAAENSNVAEQNGGKDSISEDQAEDEVSKLRSYEEMDAFAMNLPAAV